jgi:hypothetical protein
MNRAPRAELGICGITVLLTASEAKQLVDET